MYLGERVYLYTQHVYKSCTAVYYIFTDLYDVYEVIGKA